VFRDADDGKIRVRILAHDIAAHRATVRKDDSERRTVFDDVIVGEEEAVGCDDDARTAGTADVDFDDGGGDDFNRADHRLRVGVEKCGVVWLWDHESILRVLCNLTHHPDG
jgi:hypothetical protein